MIQFRAHITLLLCIALLVVRVGGAHLHLCFDGQEPSASIHLADAGDLGEHSEWGVPHKDANIDLGNDGLAKLPKLDLPLLALLLSLALCLFVQRRTGSAPPYAAPLFLGVATRFLPPLRGPPLNPVP
ncbi:MAG: hypothetical protein E6R07_07415 [Nevskiaceae bacterium]|nr:MAG: hypothetical protein E6R07_07415 [Nevskiaceae bacterium]